MDILTPNSEVLLKRAGKEKWLKPYLHWTVMDDRTTFEGASGMPSESTSVAGSTHDPSNGPGADQTDLIISSPRYSACIYVDKEAVEEANIEVDPRDRYLILHNQGPGRPDR